MDRVRARRIERLLASTADVLGLDLCLHDRQRRLGVPAARQIHGNPFCLPVKARSQAACAAFDGVEIHRALAGNPEGRVHTCPFGRIEIAVPIVCDGMLAGVLFAGPGRSRTSLEQRRPLLRAIATEIERLLGQRAEPEDRRHVIGAFIAKTLNERTSLPGLAKRLALSPSRTGHLVRELFGQTFPQLVRTIRLREAAYYLGQSDHSVAEIARFVGYDDPNYLSRQFSAAYGMSPRAYRKRYATRGAPNA